MYNRAELIKETLNSILSQSYQNWECIVVDDGSTDSTKETVEMYIKKDDRVQFFNRPKEKPKGANSCRNFGFEKSTGSLIQWFDSDDLMTESFLKLKVEAIGKENYDYVISKTEDFEHPNPAISLGINSRYYKFDEYDLNHSNYVYQKINWLTPDFLIRRAAIKDIFYNEKLSSGQEYNFLCKLTAKTTNAIFVDEVLSHRRIHADSIKGQLVQDKRQYLSHRAIIDFENWQDLKEISSSEILNYLFRKSVENSMNTTIPFKKDNIVLLAKEIKTRYGIYTALLYLSFQFIGRNFNKGHFLRKKFLREWKKG